MTKALEASCVAGVVTVDGFIVPSATVGSEGISQSSGVLLIDEDAAHYIPKTSGDLKTTLDKLVAVLAQLKTALDKTVESLGKAAAGMTKIDTHAPLVLTGVTASPGNPLVGTAAWVPVAATDITGVTTASAAVTSAATQIDLIRVELNALKGSLA